MKILNVSKKSLKKGNYSKKSLMFVYFVVISAFLVIGGNVVVKNGEITLDENVTATEFYGNLDCSYLDGNTSDLCTLTDTNETTRFNNLVSSCPDAANEKIVEFNDDGSFFCISDLDTNESTQVEELKEDVYNYTPAVKDSQLLLHIPHPIRGTDYSGYNNHGLVDNGVTWRWDSKPYFGASMFAGDSGSGGVDASVNISDSVSLDSLKDSMALSLWFKANFSGSVDGLVGKGGGANRAPFALSLTEAEDLRWHLANNTAESNIDVGASIAVDTWYHVVALLYPNGTQCVYLDGEKQPTTADYHALIHDEITPGNYDLFIGYFEVLENYFNGSIEDVRLYNHSLDTADIKDLYYNGLTGIGGMN